MDAERTEEPHHRERLLDLARYEAWVMPAPRSLVRHVIRELRVVEVGADELVQRA
eukprot:CAMPEP_0184399380 /NCGR_PEP_ID=MMETSP0007-20130409/70304_1 /TAXON_ID=97485 /ORGANISM="Prymnesium parvum, Strain Texoma1" /LENGTH=54 /DNA_ID=CAMNT_0026753811 /DNA_START=171 /DNA_END=332 /DNA_ORIENTATION=-